MRKKWVKPDFNNISVVDTNDIKPGLNANCNPYNSIPWPSGIHGPTWNEGQKKYYCSSIGQGSGVNSHLPDGDLNKIPRCPYIGINGECQYGVSAS